jgi:hypothetical protein
VRCWLILLISCSCFAGQAFYNSFNGGKLSPLTKDRLDIEKRHMGQQELDNMLCKQQGGVIRRPGTEYVAPMEIVTFTPAEDIYDAFIISGNDVFLINSDGQYIQADSSARNVQDNGDGTHQVAITVPASGFEVGDILQIGGPQMYTLNFDGADENNPIAAGDSITSGAKTGTCRTITYSTATTGTMTYNLDLNKTQFANNDVIQDGEGNSVTADGGGSSVAAYKTDKGTGYTVNGVTATEVFFDRTDPFVAQTFLGTETITKVIKHNTYPGTISTAFLDLGSGQYIVVNALVGSRGATAHIHKLDRTAFTVDDSWFDAPPEGWSGVYPIGSPMGYTKTILTVSIFTRPTSGQIRQEILSVSTDYQTEL